MRVCSARAAWPTCWFECALWWRFLGTAAGVVLQGHDQADPDGVEGSQARLAVLSDTPSSDDGRAAHSHSMGDIGSWSVVTYRRARRAASPIEQRASGGAAGVPATLSGDRIAILVVGRLDRIGIDARESYSRSLVKFVLNPIAAEGWPVDLAFCHEDGEHSTSYGDVLANSTLQKFGLAMYVASAVEPVDTRSAYEAKTTESAKVGGLPADSFVQSGRIRACYLEHFARRLASYKFVLRVRPDLEWDGPLAPPSAWSNTAFSARLRSWYGKPLKEDFFALDYGYAGCNRTFCYPGANETERMVLDDQFYVVPRQHVEVAMSFGVDPKSYSFGVVGCPLGIPMRQNEGMFTQYLINRGIPLGVLQARACFARLGGVQRDQERGCGASWELVHDCRGHRKR